MELQNLQEEDIIEKLIDLLKKEMEYYYKCSII